MWLNVNGVECEPEFHLPSAVQVPAQVPEVVEWVPADHVHWTVSPTAMVEVLVLLTSSTNFEPPSPMWTARVAATAATGSPDRSAAMTSRERRRHTGAIPTLL